MYRKLRERPPRRDLLAICCTTAVLLLPGCAASQGWDGEIQQWGSMYEVLAEGQSQGRVDLAEFANLRGTYGVGALEGLAGEVTIANGAVWLARAGPDNQPQVDRVADPHGQATLLALARVSRWQETHVTEPLSSGGVEDTIRDAAAAAGIDTGRPFPFVIEGRFAELDAHIINGRCPVQAHHLGETEAAPPVQFSARGRSGMLVGIYAENAAGEFTHHGSRTHAHVIIDAKPPLSGHVDRVAVEAGALLRLPRR